MNLLFFTWLVILNLNISLAAIDRPHLAAANVQYVSDLAKLPATRRLYPESNRVCIYVWTYLYTRYWDNQWLSKFLWYMDRVLVQSLDRQCPSDSSCSNLAQYKLIIELRGNEELNEMVKKHYENNKNIILFQREKGKGEISKVLENLLKSIAEMVKRQMCKWVSYIFIDADDVFLDGYFEYVTTDIPKLASTTSTSNGSAWRGAVFMPKNSPIFYISKDRCGVGYFDKNSQNFLPYQPKSIVDRTKFWQCGESPGRGIILKRKVWDKLASKEVRKTDHNSFTQHVREWVMHGLGYTEYSSRACDWAFLKKEIGYSIRDESESRLLYINVINDWKTSGLMITAPYSEHFPWHNITQIPLCLKEQTSAIQSIFPTDVQWLTKITKNRNISLSETCRRLARGKIDLLRDLCRPHEGKTGTITPT